MYSGTISANMSGASCPEPVRQTEVQERTQSLDRTAEALEDFANRIERRLGSVLRVSLEKDKDQPMPEPMLVPLANELRTIDARFIRSLRQLNDLYERVELPE